VTHYHPKASGMACARMYSFDRLPEPIRKCIIDCPFDIQDDLVKIMHEAGTLLAVRHYWTVIKPHVEHLIKTWEPEL
jgi:hypothetical protein